MTGRILFPARNVADKRWPIAAKGYANSQTPLNGAGKLLLLRWAQTIEMTTLLQPGEQKQRWQAGQRTDGKKPNPADSGCNEACA